MEPQNPTVPTPPQPVAPPVPATLSKNNNFLAILLSVFLAITLLIGGYLFLQVQGLTKQLAQLQVQPTATPLSTEIPSPTTDPTANWKTYNSPEIGDYFSPFQISYPPSWSIEEQLTSEEPKSLALTLTNTNSGELVVILQAPGGGGNCIYYDDPDYTTFEGMGEFFSSYIQLNKPTLWRIGRPKDNNETSYVICEKTKERYINGTRIGWIDIHIKSESTLQEFKSILEKIVFKPTAKTKTLFD